MAEAGGSKPEALDELDRRILQLKIEKVALSKEADPASKDRLQKLEKELAEAEDNLPRLDAERRAAQERVRGLILDAFAAFEAQADGGRS